MDCRDYENLITDYLEDKCDPDQKSLIDLHLSECKKCRELAKQERMVIEQLFQMQGESCPDEIIASVMKSIPEVNTGYKKRVLSWLKPFNSFGYGVASLAGSLVIILFVLFIYTGGQQRQSITGARYSPEEIRQATTEVRLALAYFAVYSRKTEIALEKIDLVDPIIKPIEGELKKAISKIPYI